MVNFASQMNGEWLLLNLTVKKTYVFPKNLIQNL
jgi:hypothetical protein